MDETQRFRWFLGIDVSKETFDGCCINMKGERVFSLSTSMNRKGFEELIKQLSGPSVSQESGGHGVNRLLSCQPLFFPYLLRVYRDCDESPAHF